MDANVNATARSSSADPGPLVLIADGERQMRRFLRCLVESWGYRPIEACTSEQAVRIGHADRPSLVLFSLELVEPDLAAAFAASLHERTAACVLVMGWAGDNHLIARALDAGADDYLIKPFTARDVASRLERLLARARQARPERGCARAGWFVIGAEHATVTSPSGVVTLSEQEHRMLLALASDPGHVMTHADLARRVWGETSSRGPNDVRVVVAALLRKLEGPRTNPPFIKIELGIGYRLDEAATIATSEGAEIRPCSV